MFNYIIKQNVTTQLALHMLKLVPQYLTQGKRFIVAGSLRGSLSDKALFIEHGCEIPKTDDRLTCNCEKGTCEYESSASTLWESGNLFFLQIVIHIMWAWGC